jgi:hypothetical protein
MLSGMIGQHRCECSLAIGSLPFKVAQQLNQAALTGSRAEWAHAIIAKWLNSDLIMMAQPEVAQGSYELKCHPQFGWLPPCHRARDINQQMDLHALLDFAKFDDNITLAGIDIPVDQAVIITSGVGSMIAKDRGWQLLAAQMLAQRRHTTQRLLWLQGQAFEPP